MNIVPIYAAFTVSVMLSLFLTLIITQTAVKLRELESLGPIRMLNLFYWSTNIVTLSIGYFLYMLG